MPTIPEDTPELRSWINDAVTEIGDGEFTPLGTAVLRPFGKESSFCIEKGLSYFLVSRRKPTAGPATEHLYYFDGAASVYETGLWFYAFRITLNHSRSFPRQ